MTHFEYKDYFAPCATGLEPLLADELRSLRCRSVRPQRAGVMFKGTTKDAYRVCLWSRLASRVLLHIADIEAKDADELYRGVKEIVWEDHINRTGTIAVDTTGVNEGLRNTQFTNVKVKDAIVDRLREIDGRRPSVDTIDPHVKINVVVRDREAKISLDISGEPLHRRGYRSEGTQVAAPMKETLAAALLIIADWPAIARAGGAFIDPMCGSATLPLEAACMAADIAPGLGRKKWGFERWRGHDEEAWASLLDEAHNRKEVGLANIVPIFGSDNDVRALEIAARAIRRAGLEDYVKIRKADISMAHKPSGVRTGLVAINPPYGERLFSGEYLPDLYAKIAQAMRDIFDGWTLAVISPDDRLPYCLAMRPRITHVLYNGKIQAPVTVYDIGPAVEVDRPRSMKGAGERSDHAQTAAEVATKRDIDVSPFENRLRKMAKHYGSWARKSDVTCYRVYDADVSDFNIAVDVYQGAGPSEGTTWVYVAEYVAPAEVDKKVSGARLWAAIEVCAAVFEVPTTHVILKRRKVQKGALQYERISGGNTTSIHGIVEEAGLDFEINLSDYLDTGVFLDQRDTRTMIHDMVKGKRFLNLFAYTGVVSVFAAAGQAASTTTVDMSRTYLDIAKRNMERNRLGVEAEADKPAIKSKLAMYKSQKNIFVQADVLQWVKDEGARNGQYDLIFCDPPTFSNSKRMESTWDVQRDHMAHISYVVKLLAPGGVLLFSCNKRNFKLDYEAIEAEGLVAKDITKRTIPKDFESHKVPHMCFEIQRSGD